MYHTLAFYYSGSPLKAKHEVATPQFYPQLQKNPNWLRAEHRQHQQWASIVTQQYDQSSVYVCQMFYSSKMTKGSTKPFSRNLTPLTVMSSKVLQAQAPLCHTEAVFPELNGIPNLAYSANVQPLEAHQLKGMSSMPTRLIKTTLRLILLRFMAWFQFSNTYLASYVRQLSLQEEARLSDSFSNGLICKWLAAYPISASCPSLSPPFLGPPQAHILNHLNGIKEHIKCMKAVSQSYLITQLNPQIRQWVSLWEVSLHWATVSYCDARLRRFLQRWAKRRHPNKGWGWVCHKYWRRGLRAAQSLFWFRLLAPALSPTPRDFGIRSSLKARLRILLQSRMQNCVGLETSSVYPWQFFCVESNRALETYSTFAFKKWRKSRAFDFFLLY